MADRPMRPLDQLMQLTPADFDSCTVEEMQAMMRAELEGWGGNMPFHLEYKRNCALDSPYYLATEVLDPYYAEHFEPVHRHLLDEVMAPYMLGQPVTIEGQEYDPRQYRGLIVLFSRSTFKSTCLRIIATWLGPYRKIRLGEDARIMLTHQVIEKAVEHSEAMRSTARENQLWKQIFPEFSAPPGKEWDTKSKWRWPCFTSYQAAEYSLTCYGETSSKVGGHYTDRIVDDWVTEDSVTNSTQLDLSHDRFRAMDNLRDRARKYNPWLVCGTHYHFQDTYKRVEDAGGWLVWRKPAHTGSPKRIFDLASMDIRSESGRLAYESGIRRLEKDPPGKLHFPTLLPWRELVESARAQGPLQYNCQLLLNPVPEGEQRFDRDALRACWVDEIPSAQEMWLYLRCDPAISVKREADETAISVGGVRWDGHRFFVDGWVGREKRPAEQAKKMFTLARKWIARGYRVKNIGIESVAYQEALAQICRDGVPSRKPEYDGESVPMLTKPCSVRSIKRSSEVHKTERILEMDAPIARRELHIWNDCPVGAKTIRQLENFPFDRFDALDALHDAWGDGTQTPPRPMTIQQSNIPPWFAEAMRAKSDGPRLCDTNNTVRLANWG